VKRRKTEPVRGDVYLCEFDPAVGSEQAGTRPAVIVERTTLSRLAAKRHVLLAPMTSNKKCARLPFCVAVAATAGTGLKRKSYVNVSHIHAFSKARLKRRLGKLSDSTMAEVDDALRLIFDLEDDSR